jgi:2-iminoacetate synthase
VSQIDAGTRLELGGYAESCDDQHMNREQFELGDGRSLDQVMRELMVDGYLPSFCTACYRLGRTGEHFMEFAIPGFIKRFCTPNAITTLMEYLTDYGSAETKAAGEKLIQEEIEKLDNQKMKEEIRERLRQIKETDQRDLYF